MPRYRIEFELDYSGDEELMLLVSYIQGAAPVLGKGGVHVVRESARPWAFVKVLASRPAPRRARERPTAPKGR